MQWTLQNENGLTRARGNTHFNFSGIPLLSGFLFFPLIGIVMALCDKYAGGPFTFLLLFKLAAFLLVLLYGSEVPGITGNFFSNTGLGDWISCGALFAPFLAMFFLDKRI